MKIPFRLMLLLALGAFALNSWAAEVSVTLPPGTVIPEAAQPGPDFDPAQATEAYLALYTPEQRARSDAYFEGGYWLQLWNWLAGIAVAWLMLRLGWAARLRDWAARRSSTPWIQTFLFVVTFLALLWLLTLPLTVYQGYFREHQYGSSNLTLGGWFVESLIGLAFTLVGAGLFITLLYSLVRKTGERWWAWATAATFAFLLFVITVTPVFINPAFNDYKPLPGGRDARVHPVAGARQPDPRRQRDVVRRLEADQAHQRERRGHVRHDADKPERQPAGEDFAARDPGGDGARDGALRAQSRIAPHRLSGTSVRAGIPDPGSRADYAARATRRTLAHQRPRRPRFAGGGVRHLLDVPVPRAAGRESASSTRARSRRTSTRSTPRASRMGSRRWRCASAAIASSSPARSRTILFYDHPSGRERVRMSMEWLKENQALFEQRAAVREIDGESAMPATR